ncbi:hypothetical protein [Microlunatus flavus]|uniref:DUF1772 domain-containing protein n=1 Tax=Microlunatus flavus TaxID=1036181 RepID=A0A1H9HYM6_9ACTN|nr:hypothetical protein [Microlunatus flavus]SEQ67476.1 hypothetical protein SAMN05421756_1053 [Microlunatus flavus]
MGVGVVLWAALLVAATALHAGFQLTVTALTYPALVEVEETRFARAHALHSRRIVPLVALVYGTVVVTCLGALVTAPGAVAVWVAAAASAVAVLVTALRAAPLHGRLGRHGPDAALLTALTRADRVRTAAALAALVAAVVHAAGF